MDVTPEQLEQSWRAFLSAFDYTELQRLLYFKLGRGLAEIVPASTDFQNTCFELLREAEKAGWLEELIRAAIADRPKNERLRQLELDLGLETSVASPAVETVVQSVRRPASSVEDSSRPQYQPETSLKQKAFISYSHKDQRHRERLNDALIQLRRSNLMSVWDDRKILPGQDWDREISDKLEDADVILLLVSPDFLASDYSYSREMARALERHRSGTATMIPIIVRPCDWQHSPLGSLQALPDRGRAVSLWPSRDQAWLDVVQGLRRLISG
jgi:TIR domain/Effector-associated domain 1